MKTTAFKMTELGPIPSDWEVKRLGEVCVINPSSSRQIPDSFVYIDLESVVSGQLVVEKKISHTLAPSRAQRLFSRGDVLYQTVRPYQRNNLFVDFDASGYVASTGYAVLHPVNSVSDSGYIFQQIHFPSFVSQVLDNCTGTSYPAINPHKLGEIIIPLPPLPEQHRIAAALSDMDELIGALGKLVEKKRAIKTGTMQRLLTGQTRLPGFGGEWEEKRLGEIGKFSKGAGISKEQSNSGLLPAVRYGELYTTHHDYIRHFESFISEDVAKCATQLHEGDIIFACSGETKEEIGKCAAYLGKEVAYAGGDLIICTPTAEYDSLFLGFELNTPFCAQQKAAAGQGDAVVHIRQESIATITVSVPPTLPEQRAIAAVLSDMDEEIAALETEKRKVEAIKQGMMQELLTGKTRLW